MNPSRFWNQAPRPRDSKIVRRASMFKLTMYREKDGELSCSFEIEGSFGNFSNEASQEGVPDGLRFVRELMRQFAAKPDDAMGEAG